MTHPSRVRFWTRALLGLVITVAVPLVMPTGYARAATAVFADGFESGTLAAWTVRTGAGGSAAATQADVATGLWAARLSETSASGSVANARVTLPAMTDVTVSGTFKVVAEGVAGGNTPLLRLFSSSGTRVISLYRQNQSGNRVWIQINGVFTATTGLLSLGTWARADVHVVVNGGASTIEVRLGGSLIYQTGSASIGTAPITTVQIGNDTSAQAFTMAVDDIAVTQGSTPTPTPTPTPGSCNPATPQPPYPFSVPGVPIILTDNFEATTIGAQWSVTTSGDGTVTVSTTTSHTGLCAGKFTVSTSDTSMAYISKDLGGSKTDVWASGWFDVAQPGPAGNDVPYLRFFDGSNRIADIFRQNSGGDAWLRTANGSGGWNYFQLNVLMPLNTWHQVTLHVAPAGASSTVEVWIDGVGKYTSTAFNLHTTTQLTAVHLGAEHVSQQAVEYFDDVTIGAS